VTNLNTRRPTGISTRQKEKKKGDDRDHNEEKERGDDSSSGKRGERDAKIKGSFACRRRRKSRNDHTNLGFQMGAAGPKRKEKKDEFRRRK